MIGARISLPTCIPQPEKDVVHAGIGKHQSGLVRLYGGDHILVFYDLHMLQNNGGILGIVLQPEQSYRW